MKFVQPSVEYWQQEAGMEGVWKQITRATRVSYQSKQKEDESDLDFVKRVILKPALIEGNLNNLTSCKFDFDKMHGAMLEHGTVYLVIPWVNDASKVMLENRITLCTYDNNPYSIVKEGSKESYVTTNLRVIAECNRWKDLRYLCEPTEYHVKRYTFDVITDIGVSREGNRMRANSICEESTRYNAYDKGKYGSELTYVKPAWYDKSDKINELFAGMTKEQQDESFRNWCGEVAEDDIKDWDANSYWRFALKAAEFAYMGIRHNGNGTWTAEKARQVLNLNTKTNVVWTAYAGDWKHFLALRSSQAVSGKPHENMVVVADKIAEIAKEQKLW